MIPKKGTENTLEQSFANAYQLYKNRKFNQSLDLCTQIISKNPNHIETLRLIGAIAYQNGQYEQALSFFNKAIQVNPNDDESYLFMGIIEKARDNTNQSVTHYFKAIQIKPNNAKAYYNIGNVLQSIKNNHEASLCYFEAIKIDNTFSDAYTQLGILFLESNLLKESIQWLKHSLSIQSENCMALYHLGIALYQNHQIEDALSILQKTIAIQPDFYRAYFQIGMILQSINPEDAIACFRMAISMNPDCAEAHYNLGVMFQREEKNDDAIHHYQKAIQIMPHFSAAQENLGYILFNRGQINQALQHYRKSLEISASLSTEIKIALLIPPIMDSKESITTIRNHLLHTLDELDSKGQTLVDPLKQVGMTSFYLAYHGMDDKPIQQRLSTFFSNRCPNLSWTAPHIDKNHHRDKIHIGFISNHLYTHTIGFLNQEIIQNLSRDRFHVTVCHTPYPNDPISKKIHDSVDCVIPLTHNLFQCREDIAKAKLDILFYLDIGMEPKTFFLAFSRLAPIQCVTWGHPVTTGIPTMDYYLSTQSMEPVNAQSHYSEKLELFNHIIAYIARSYTPLPATSKSLFGFSNQDHLYVCPQSLFKIHPDFDPILNEILKKDKQGTIIFVDGMHRHWSKQLQKRFSQTISNHAKRVRFLPRMVQNDYLSLLSIADVILDTPHFNGGKTSIDALCLGKPIITFPGQFMRQRITSACYHQMNLSDCIAKDSESYVNQAVSLACDQNKQKMMSQRICDHLNLLIDNHSIIRELEDFFTRVYDHK